MIGVSNKDKKDYCKKIITTSITFKFCIEPAETKKTNIQASKKTSLKIIFFTFYDFLRTLPCHSRSKYAIESNTLYSIQI